MRTLFLLCFSVQVLPLYAQLEPREASIVRISSYTADGNLKELKGALVTGLDRGLSVNEIKEVLVHTYAYCGFPRSIRGLQTFMEVLNSRKERGVLDEVETEVYSSGGDRYRRGQENLAKLNGVPPSDSLQGYGAFAPVMDRFLKEHLFADIFEREVLTYRERELITIAVIASIGKAEPMLQSHVKICRRLGISEAELIHVGLLLQSTVGKSAARSYHAVRLTSL
jgi:4-carboxymuconolactone decarboxylase